MLKTKLPLIALTATLLTGCCLEDHRPTIRKVAEPMLKELEAFYKQNKRFPNTKERDEMLEKAGCKMKGDICMFEEKKLIIRRSEEVTPKRYYFVLISYPDIKISRSKASCGFGIHIKSGIREIRCTKRPCFEFRQ